MAMYYLKKDEQGLSRLAGYEFASEGSHTFSPQQIIIDYPEILIELSELEMLNSDAFLAVPEYSTGRGSIDLLVIGSNAEVVIVETKLLRNPESTRQVVAQIIDYVKALSEESLEVMIQKVKGKYPEQAAKLNNDVNFASLVTENIRTGNFQVLVVGDYIHPNVLGMISSIHSAPHLSFTIHLVDLNTYSFGGEDIILQPRVVASTVEIERSVIRIEIEPDKIDYRIQSETPEKKGKGRKPILKWDQYLENISQPTLKPVLQKFRDRWLTDIDDSINMGQVGFSAGLEYGGKRIPIQFVYDNRIPIISERHRQGYDIPKNLYEEYLSDLKESSMLYDKYIVSGKVEVNFEDLDQDTLTIMLNAAINLAQKYKQMS
jgi:hypothetical protein